MGLAVAMSCAFAAAVCYGVGTFAQAVGARAAAPSDHLDPRLFADLLRRTPYLAGLALDVLGFGASVVALHRLPLFFVQAVITSSVGVTVLLAIRFMSVRLQRTEKAALVAMGVGLTMLAVAARPESAKTLSHLGEALVLAGVGVVAVVGVLAGRGAGPRSAVSLAVAAGLGFAGVGIAARALVVPDSLWRLALSPLAWAVAGYGGLATLLFATALQRGSVTTAAALTFAVETVVPTVVGVAFLGDRARPSLTSVAVVGFVLTVAAAIALARHAEVTPRSTPPPPVPAPL